MFILAAKHNKPLLLEKLLAHDDFNLTDKVASEALKLQASFNVVEVILREDVKIKAAEQLLAELAVTGHRVAKTTSWILAKVWKSAEGHEKWVRLLLNKITNEEARNILPELVPPKRNREANNLRAQVACELINKGALLNDTKIKDNLSEIKRALRRSIYIPEDTEPFVSINTGKIANAFVTWVCDNWSVLNKNSKAFIYKSVALTWASVLEPVVFSKVSALPCEYELKRQQDNGQFKSSEAFATLEKDLAAACKEHDVDLSAYAEVENYVVSPHRVWPIPFTNHKTKTFGLLNKLLLAKEREHGINTDPNAPAVFSGFVPKGFANKIVGNGNLFVEFKGASEVLHGIYSHRLQWYLELSRLGKNVNAKKLVFDSIPTWNKEYDSIDPTKGISSPHALHSILLNSQDKLPTLCYYLRKVFASSLRTIIAAQSVTPQGKPRISASQVVTLNILSNGNVGTAGLRPVNPLKYYQAKKTELIFLHPKEAPNPKARKVTLGEYQDSAFFKKRKNNNTSTLIKRDRETPVETGDDERLTDTTEKRAKINYPLRK